MKTLVTRRRLLLALTATAVYPGALFDEVASAACIPHEDASNHAADQVKGLLGRWRSTVFRRGLLLEWGDASGCELIISDKARLSAEEKLEIGQNENISGVAALPNSPYVIRLYLSNGGETWLAPDAMPGWLAPGRALCLGPLGSHLVFTYCLDEGLLALVRGRHHSSSDMASPRDIVLKKSPIGQDGI